MFIYHPLLLEYLTAEYTLLEMLFYKTRVYQCVGVFFLIHSGIFMILIIKNINNINMFLYIILFFMKSRYIEKNWSLQRKDPDIF